MRTLMMTSAVLLAVALLTGCPTPQTQGMELQQVTTKIGCANCSFDADSVLGEEREENCELRARIDGRMVEVRPPAYADLNMAEVCGSTHEVTLVGRLEEGTFYTEEWGGEDGGMFEEPGEEPDDDRPHEEGRGDENPIPEEDRPGGEPDGDPGDEGMPEGDSARPPR